MKINRITLLLMCVNGFIALERQNNIFGRNKGKFVKVEPGVSHYAELKDRTSFQTTLNTEQ